MFVSQANKLLGASCQLYRNTKSNETITCTVGYALSVVLRTQIQDVAPTAYFIPARVMQQIIRRRPFGPTQEQARSASRAGITPSILRWLHGTVAYEASATDQNKLGVVGFLNECPRQEDLTSITITHDTFAADATPTVIQVNGGGYDPDKPPRGFERQRPVRRDHGVPDPAHLPSAGHLGDPFLPFLGYLVREPNIPQIIGMPYGMEQVPPLGYAMAVCNLFAQLGVRGASVLFTSGINGVRRRWELRPVRPRIPCILYVWCFIAATQAQVQVAHQTTMFFRRPLGH